MMGMVDGIFDHVSLEDMPAGYHSLRTDLKLTAIKIKNNQEVARQKIQLYSGIQNVSVENINKSNSIRFDSYNSFLKLTYPYLDFEKKENKDLGTLEDLVAEYKKIFSPSQKEQD